MAHSHIWMITYTWISVEFATSSMLPQPQQLVSDPRPNEAHFAPPQQSESEAQTSVHPTQVASTFFSSFSSFTARWISVEFATSSMLPQPQQLVSDPRPNEAHFAQPQQSESEAQTSVH